MRLKLGIVVLVCILNFYLILGQTSLLILPFLIVTSCLLLILFFKKGRNLTILLTISTSLLFLYVLKKEFDRGLFEFTNYESYIIYLRRSFFVQNFGRIYANRFGIYYSDKIRPILSKFVVNMFSHLEFNSFFKVENFLSLVFMPLFVLGGIDIIKVRFKYFFYYFLAAFLFSGLLIREGIFGLALFVPLVNVFITLGILKFINIHKS